MPPILVLSYKNHAIDEFLLDLIKAERNLNMIRIGGGATDPALDIYSERRQRSSQTFVVQALKKIENIHKVREEPRKLLGCHAKILLSKTDKVDDGQDDLAAILFKRKLKIEAADALKNILSRISIAAQFSPGLDLTMDSDLTSISSFLRDMELNCKGILDFFDGAIKKTHQMKFSFEILREGIRHVDPLMNISEVIFRWMSGSVPPPQCKAGIPQCESTCSDGSYFCDAHACVICVKQVRVTGKDKCAEHACMALECSLVKLNLQAQIYCSEHACILCLEEGGIAGIALDEPPRNTCILHPLCCSNKGGEQCYNIMFGDTSFCEEHQRALCKGVTNKGQACKSRLTVSNSVPFCFNHRDQAPKLIMQVSSKDSKSCLATNKKGSPCKGTPIPGLGYCRDHIDQSQRIESTGEKIIHTEVHWQKITEDDCIVEVESDLMNKSVEIAIKEDSLVPKEDIVEVSTNQKEDFQEDSDHEQVELEAALFDVDEMDESDNLHHLREVYGIQDDEMENSEEDYDSEVEATPVLENYFKWNASPNWTWKLSLEQRWDIIENVLHLDTVLLSHLGHLLIRESKIARDEYRLAKIKASSAVYENKEIIGGTIVGCIARLEAIRSTSPFAILIEEASEVMEPLLFACLGPSTCKLEMIGDHLQLQPSIMAKFDFEKINKVNISMFERLICAPDSHPVPATVLSVQRRMRKNICDLVRGFYSEITPIVDHPKCHDKAIGDSNLHKSLVLKRAQGEGLLVPCILPQIFFWSHSGSQGRAQVGLSKVNQTECDMVSSLAHFLVISGVPRASIAILTPYKGQLMLIRKELMKSKRPLICPNPQDSVIVSTVDRFQVYLNLL